MLTLLLATTICVLPGTITEVEFDFRVPLANGGVISSLNRYVATAYGYVPPGGSHTTITVEGIREGESMFAIGSGPPLFHPLYLGTIIVVDEMLAVTVSPAHSVVATGTPVTLTAITSGADVDVVWYEGERYLGIGHSIAPRLERGEHRITAQAWNRCGTVTSETVVSVVKPRQRAARH